MRIASSIIFLFLLQLVAFGASRIEATVDRNNLSLQETLVLTIGIVSDDKNASDVSVPDFPQDFPFQILRKAGPSRSSQSSVRLINGRLDSTSTITTSFQFLLKPTETGTLTIPALGFTCGKDTLRTDPITIQVGNAKQNNASNGDSQLQFRQYLSSENTVMGASVTLTYELCVPESLNLSSIGPDYNAEKILADFKAEGFENQEWERRSTLINGIRYMLFRKDIRLTPKHPGTMEIPGCLLTYQYVAPRQENSRNNRRRDFFESFFEDNPFFGMGGQLEEKTIVSDPITLQVEDFPTEGRPANFTGLIGPIQASASVDIQDVYVGDPITLTVRIKGDNLDQECTLPDLKSILEKDGKFRLSGDDSLSQYKDGSLLYSKTFRALSSEVTQIPPLEIPYYDVKRKAYDYATTNAIPLNVQDVKKVTLGDAHVQGNIPLSIPLPSTPQTELQQTDGALEIIDQDALLQRTWSPLPEAKNQHKTLLLLFLVPPGAWLAVAIAMYFRRKNARISLAERIARNAKRHLKNTVDNLSGEDSQDGKRLAEAWKIFLGERFGIVGAVTPSDLQDTMTAKGFSPEQIKEAQETLEECDAAQYGGAALPFQDLKIRILKTADLL